MKQILTAVLFLTIRCFAVAQTCTTPGQTPSTAFPVCGTTVFHQKTVPLCGVNYLPVPGCSDNWYKDENPYWYRFTCYKSGTLGFVISPLDSLDDYDWQLYDITGRDPNDVYHDRSLIVTGNWAGTPGKTGTADTGVNFIQCGSFPDDSMNAFAQMPDLVQGHTYILLVSHFDYTQTGYDLSFGGGTAIIAEPLAPKLIYAEANCGGDIIRVKLNKKMKCNSIASDGSDFYITPGFIPVKGVSAINCSSGFDTDSLELQLSTLLVPGTYNINIKTGTDGNTLLDYCDNPIPGGDKAGFTILPLSPTPMDSLTPLKCESQSMRLVFGKPMLCSSIAADGSDFKVSGAFPVTITGASGNCTGGAITSKEIVILLSQPLGRGGSYTLTLRRGSDGNTLRDECNQETVEGSALNFSIKDAVDAEFTYKVIYGCGTDTVNFFHSGANGVNTWQWNLDENKTSSRQNPQAVYKTFNTKKVTLFVSNGFCSDSSFQSFTLDNFLKAEFDTYTEVCPNEPTKFTSLARGHIVRHSWHFGDGLTSAEASPLHIYAGPNATTYFVVKYTVADSIGCESIAEKSVKVHNSCYLAVPNAFTPNGDGKNDYLYPVNAIKADNLDFKVYDRWGQLIFQTNDWRRGWDGSLNGKPQPSGVYLWFLTYKDRDKQEARQLKGTAVLIR